jgi:small subunit ribosomal protein S20
MPTHASTAKHMRSDKRKRLRNRKIKSSVKSMEKKVRQAEDKEQAQADLTKATSMLDKAASKGVIHRKIVSRHKSRLAKRVNAMAEKTKADKAAQAK